jgi:hypothetical protein
VKYLVDIDGTICSLTDGKYEEAIPFVDRIKYLNEMYDKGHTIVYWTARGGNSGKDWSLLTKQQLFDWNVKYNELLFNKPTYDIWIDDKAMNAERFFDDIDNWV